MAPITTIVHFEVPADTVDRFFDFWQDQIRDYVSRQPGLIGGILYRGIDTNGPFQFINVAQWESAEQLAAGLRAASEDLPIARTFQDLRVKVSQNNYAEAVRYAPARGAASAEAGS